MYNKRVFFDINNVPFNGQQAGAPGKVITPVANMHGGASVMFTNTNVTKGGGPGVHFSIPKDPKWYDSAHHTSPYNGVDYHRFYKGKFVRRRDGSGKIIYSRRVLGDHETIGPYVDNFAYIQAILDNRQKMIERLNRQYNAATKLQSRYRGKKARNNVKKVQAVRKIRHIAKPRVAQFRRRKIENELIKQAINESSKRRKVVNNRLLREVLKESQERQDASNKQRQRNNQHAKNVKQKGVLQKQIATVKKAIKQLEKEHTKAAKRGQQDKIRVLGRSILAKQQELSLLEKQLQTINNRIQN